MAITATHLTATADTSNVASYATASITPTANRLVLAAVFTAKATATVATPTLSGNSLTWVNIANIANSISAVGTRRLTLFRAMGAAPTAGVLTADMGGVNQAGCGIHVTEFADVNTSGTNGAGAVLQPTTNETNSGTSLTVTLAAFASASNGTFGAFLTGGTDSAATEGSGFAELSDNGYLTPTQGLMTEWRNDNDTTVNASWGSAGVMLGGALEIVAAPISYRDQMPPLIAQ